LKFLLESSGTANQDKTQNEEGLEQATVSLDLNRSGLLIILILLNIFF